jgi:ribose/xylose/arabinose/galactoside ABC-type transport system permease subunit
MEAGMSARGIASGWGWEAMLVALLIAAVIIGHVSSPLYFNVDQISYSMQDAIAVVGLIAVGLTVVVIVGEIDISLPATLALGNIMFARMSLVEVPIALALPLVLLVCGAAGACRRAARVSEAWVRCQDSGAVITLDAVV